MKVPESEAHINLEPVDEPFQVSSRIRQFRTVPFKTIKPIYAGEGGIFAGEEPETGIRYHNTIPYQSPNVSAVPFDPESMPESNVIYQITEPKLNPALPGLPLGSLKERAYMERGNVLSSHVELFPSADVQTLKILQSYIDSHSPQEQYQVATVMARTFPRVMIDSNRGLFVISGDQVIAAMSPTLKVNGESIHQDPQAFSHNIPVKGKFKDNYNITRSVKIDDAFSKNGEIYQDAISTFNVDFGTPFFGDIQDLLLAARETGVPLDEEKLRKLVNPSYSMRFIEPIEKLVK